MELYLAVFYVEKDGLDQTLDLPMVSLDRDWMLTGFKDFGEGNRIFTDEEMHVASTSKFLLWTEHPDTHLFEAEVVSQRVWYHAPQGL